MIVRKLIDRIDLVIDYISKFEIHTNKELNINNNGETTFLYETKNKDFLKKGLIELEKIGLQKWMLEVINSHDFIGSSSTNISTNFNTIYNIDFKLAIEILLENLKDIRSSYLLTIPNDSEDSVFVKIPINKNFDEISSFYKDLGFVFLIFNWRELKSKVVIRGGLYGSHWIQIALGSVVAVKLFFDLLKSASVVYKTYQEAELFKKQKDYYGVLIEEKDLDKKIKDRSNNVSYSEATELAKKYGKGEDKEEIVRIQNSIDSLKKLIINKVEFMHSTLANKEMKRIFTESNVYKLNKNKQKNIPQDTTEK